MVDLDFTVRRYGADTSGRPLYFTVAFWTVWTVALADPRLDGFRSRIVIVQGAWMERAAGGGAAASAGYHDKAGCIDVRTWNLTLDEQAVLWAVMDDYGIRFWKRGPAYQMGGMDEHGHGLAIWDRVLAAGALFQANQARDSRDGLARNGPDYMRREHPVLEQPPAHVFQEDYMATDDAQRKLDEILEKVDHLDQSLETFRDKELQRDRAAAKKAKASKAALVARLGGLADRLVELEQAVSDDATKAQVRDLKTTVLTALADDPDVDGPENPATS